MTFMGESKWDGKALGMTIAVGLFSFLVAAFMCTSCARYANPAMEVESYGELREALSGFPDVRFADLSRYDGVPGFEFEVFRHRVTGAVGDDFYLVHNYGGGARYGMKGAAEDVGVVTELADLDIECRRLSSFDGHYRTAPSVAPNEEHGGVAVECRSSERAITGGEKAHEATFAYYPVGALYGHESYAFSIGDYYYRVGATYGILPDTPADEADAIRVAVRSEVRDIAYSIIDQ